MQGLPHEQAHQLGVAAVVIVGRHDVLGEGLALEERAVLDVLGDLDDEYPDLSIVVADR